MSEQKFSESKVAFLAKLSKLKEELPVIPKTESAYEGRYSYAPLDGVLEVVEPKMRDLKLWYMHEMNCDTESTLQYITTTVFDIETGEQFSSTTSVDPATSLAKMNAFMVVGSALTYFRRYHLVTMLGLTTDADNDAGGSTVNSRAVDKVEATVDYYSHLSNLINAGKNKTSVMKFFNIYKGQMSSDVVKKCKSLIEKTFS